MDVIRQFLFSPLLSLQTNTVGLDRGGLCIDVSSCQYESNCPVCSIKSHRVHSKYIRTLQDLPISGKVARIELIARKYFCDNPLCLRKIFTERFDSEIRPYHRRLIRSGDLLCRMALELGGNTGSVISGYVGIPVSSSTILRIIKRLDIKQESITSGIIGIDDWAFKKGKTYGTIVVDLVTRKVIDLLADRQSDTLAAWLQKHPEITLVSRDRYSPYATGIRNGAPQAQQVADRFHLLMNLGEATKKVFQSKAQVLRTLFNQFNAEQNTTVPTKKDDIQRPVQDYTNPPIDINVQKQYRFEKAKELHLAGHSIRSISRTLKISRVTINGYLSQEKLSKRQTAKSTNLDAFRSFLFSESSGSKTYKELYHSILKMGFNGKYSRFCQNMNDIWGLDPSLRIQNIGDASVIKSWSPTKLSLMLYMEQDQLVNKDDSNFLKLLFEECPEIKLVGELVKKFKALFINKQDGMLQAWIDEATMPECAIKGFAKNLIKDFAAINNAVITPFSNGQVEGQVNRLKTIKRKMYGKAGFSLLRKMVLAKS